MRKWTQGAIVLVLTGWSAAFFSWLPAQSGATSIYSADKVQVRAYLSTDAVHPGGAFDAALQLDIAEHWHINSHFATGEFLIATEVLLEPSAAFELSGVRYPPGQLYQFSFSEELVDVYEGTVFIYLNLRAADGLEAGDYQLNGRLIVQACEDKVCLAPSEMPVGFEIPVVEPHVEVTSVHADIFSQERMYTVGRAAPPGASQDVLDLAAMFDEQGWLLFFGAIFLVGLALNLTPCVYPMMTVTLSVFGTQTDPSTFRVFLRASVYVLGICTMYSLLGLMAALSGGLFGAALQSPWVLVGIAVLFLLLALSMFGLYEIQMPQWLTRRLGGTTVAGTLGLYLSGLVVGVFAAPCIGPPIIALLALVGQRADPVFGFTSFFVLSLGLGFPYLILGTFSGLMTRLPRSGVWMVWVKKVFGVVLVAVGVFYLCLAYRPDWIYVLIPLTLVIGGAYLGFVESSRGAHYLFPWIKRAAGVSIAGIGLFFYFAGQKPSLDWTPYSSERLAAAQQDSRPAVLYFAADWCIPCLELDRLTFTNREVINRMDRLVRLKVDLTLFDSPDSQSLRERFNIAGVPTIIFLEPQGAERADLRVVGYVPASDLLRRVEDLQELHAHAGTN
jgi:thioredoxin:protein disulfide reductase